MITINILPEDFKPLPIIFDTASAYLEQCSIEYTEDSQYFYQILFVLDGKGTVFCNGEEHKLKKGCAFFTAANTESKYTNEGGLITAFLTITGIGASQLTEHFGYGKFRFFPSVNLEKYIEKINEIITEYYKEKNESILSALSYSFFTEFFLDQQESSFVSLDKTALYIEKNFSNKLSLNELAEVNKTSVSKLCHDFKSKYGCSVFQYVLNLRLNYAYNLLSSVSGIKTKDVAAACGFDDISYFCSRYKRKFGTSPLNTANSLKTQKKETVLL